MNKKILGIGNAIVDVFGFFIDLFKSSISFKALFLFKSIKKDSNTFIKFISSQTCLAY